MGNPEIIGCRLPNNQTVKGVRFDCIEYNLFLLLGEHSVPLCDIVEPRESEEALYIGIQHNKEKEPYYDLLCRYRMILKCVGGKEICKNVEPDTIKAWKAKLTLVDGYENVSMKEP